MKHLNTVDPYTNGLTDTFGHLEGPGHISNWPDLPPCRPRRPVAFVAIDVDGVTACTCSVQADYMEKARWYQTQGHAVEVRFVELQDEDYELDKALRQSNRQQGQVSNH